MANPPGPAELAQLRNRSLYAENGVTLHPRVPHQLPLPEGEGATMDLEMELELPPSDLSLSLRVLGGAGGTGNAPHHTCAMDSYEALLAHAPWAPGFEYIAL